MVCYSISSLGGKANLVSAAHCATRLRLVTVDNSKIDMKKLEDIEGVKGVFSSNGQLQLIIGTGTVNKVYEEFLKYSGMSAASKDDVKAAAAAKQPVFQRMIKSLGAVIGMIMIHPNLVNAWSVGSMAAADIPVWNLLGFEIRQVGYQGHDIPVIIATWLMCKIEKWLHKHVPEMIDLFVTPLTTVLITAFLTLGIIGPIFSTAETYILAFAEYIITVGHGIGAAIMGAACLAVGLKSKNNKTKAIAIPSALSAALGITEPAIFGVNLRFVKPLVCGMIGAAAGSLVGAIFGIGATS